ncbi:helix-turn-helix domain-containing protein [Phocoenobacter skyensis]|uniref:Helix-turn-helix n=1 Tax=Phocoenobacter skyensis TaxID=97481 RepID=A0A1H7Y5F2_9PAST|nr:helix-turn-helix transcriptional regulator [Pasteurella skyensis]MDP8079953.1 helix-turn-helix transcriptional regulator [Pasteurella skyensis]MDP8085849.1 helix-turn-helix transcriptional regulator [Pasteurella skyensis]MDP8185707.1 helix-turn-helix transcriptional regulator [Pasteurella skyensis]QLB22330.1 transcriptional regulator [Pasteurella skyensis]SEM41171.1 Helix-turn-helix [Pasteurella skyensis]
MNELTNIQIINNEKGLPAFAVIPYALFEELRENGQKIDFDTAVPKAVVDDVFDNNVTPLRAWRNHLGLSQKEMANRLGISQAGYSKHENSEKLTKLTREKMAKVLNITPEQLDF